MNGRGPYRDANANPYSGSQMQRMQQNAGLNNFHGQPDSFPAEQGNPYVSAQWDRDGLRRMHPTFSHPYSEARQGSSAAQSFHQPQLADSEQDLENEASKRPRFQSHEQDMEIGYEDKPSPLTFNVLEQKFQNEILKLLKEQSDAEDAEIARHRERIIEINNQYQEKLVALRAHQASRREEFLHKESEGRLQHYRQAGMSNPPGTTGPNDLHVYGAPAAMEAHRAYPGGKTDFNRERPPYHGGGRSQGAEGRIPYPAGRVYNNPGTRYY